LACFIGGIIEPFIKIKLIDMIITSLHWTRDRVRGKKFAEIAEDSAA